MLNFSKKLFKDMSLLGSTLVSLHAMKNNNKKSSYFKNNKTKFFGDILKLEKNYPKFSNDKLEINNKSYFSPIRKEEWEFTIGGYQILKKWLKDRNDQIFNEKVLNEYLKVIIIIKETLKIKELIDSKIESAGGWKTNFIDD